MIQSALIKKQRLFFFTLIGLILATASSASVQVILQWATTGLPQL